MSSLNFFETNSRSSHLTVLKLQDDGCNWADYAPRLQKAMGARGLWRHVEGKATVPKPYELVNGIQVLRSLLSPPFLAESARTPSNPRTVLGLS